MLHMGLENEYRIENTLIVAVPSGKHFDVWNVSVDYPMLAGCGGVSVTATEIFSNKWNTKTFLEGKLFSYTE